MDSKRLKFRKGDILAILAVLLIAAAVFVWFFPDLDTPAGIAEIYQDGKLIKTVSLAENQTFTVEGKYTNTITVENGKIAVTASDCPGEDCVQCGWNATVNRSIVCLPNGLEIRVISGDSEVDFVVG